MKRAKTAIKTGIRRVLSAMGYEIQPIRDEPGRDAFADMRRLVVPGRRPLIFDVGANKGQTICNFRNAFADPIIHAFEPGRGAFAELQKRTAGMANLFLNEYGLGSQPTVMEFIENDSSDMSSFLEPGSDCWGTIVERRSAPVSTIDEYCAQHGISNIDILKSDTQGFDLEVLKGAERMLTRHCVHQVFLEIIFSDLYKNLPRLDEIYAFLADRGFALVSFYAFHYQHQRAGWTDALFINSKYPLAANLQPAAGAS